MLVILALRCVWSFHRGRLALPFLVVSSADCRFSSLTRSLHLLEVTILYWCLDIETKTFYCLAHPCFLYKTTWGHYRILFLQTIPLIAWNWFVDEFSKYKHWDYSCRLQRRFPHINILEHMVSKRRLTRNVNRNAMYLVISSMLWLLCNIFSGTFGQATLVQETVSLGILIMCKIP